MHASALSRVPLSPAPTLHTPPLQVADPQHSLLELHASFTPLQPALGAVHIPLSPTGARQSGHDDVGPRPYPQHSLNERLQAEPSGLHVVHTGLAACGQIASPQHSEVSEQESPSARQARLPPPQMPPRHSITPQHSELETQATPSLLQFDDGGEPEPELQPTLAHPASKTATRIVSVKRRIDSPLLEAPPLDPPLLDTPLEPPPVDPPDPRAVTTPQRAASVAHDVRFFHMQLSFLDRRDLAGQLPNAGGVNRKTVTTGSSSRRTRRRCRWAPPRNAPAHFE